jgi:hypothetical protein
MIVGRITRYMAPTLVGMLMVTATAVAQDEPSECVEMGGLAYDDWTKEESGGAGELPQGVDNKDYIRCKACHGWDHMATDGGYVRRSRKDTRPNAGAGDGDSTSRNISLAAREGADVTADMIWHDGTGRAYTEGTGSWVPLDDTHSSANKAAHSNGYTLGNQHPDYTLGGLTQMQADCLAEFLNFAGADPTAYFSAIDPSVNPVLYTIVDTADANAGETFFNDSCSGCHTLQFTLDYLESDGKFSELAHKARWGAPGTPMTRGLMGDPTAENIADMLLYLQQAGGTGFALNPGLTGTWWNEDRSGEGFLLEVGYVGGELYMFASFYTYDSEGNQVWLTAQLTSADGATATVDVFMPEGGQWGDNFDPASVTVTPWGAGTFAFTGCGGATATLTPNAEMEAMGFTEWSDALTRSLEPGIDCPIQVE